MATQPPPEPAAAGRLPLYAALLDHHRHPGRLSVARREPAVLFASIRTILQLAAGKSSDEAGAVLQPAAAFFVRSALIRPGCDHYTLLGVGRTSDAATIKEHYRLMIRLVHPDFSAGPGPAWPSDAAARINLAYEVLTSPGKRAPYDESLSAPAAAPRTPPPARHSAPVAPKPITTEPRVLVKRLAGGFGLAGLLGIIALVVAGSGDGESLIQRNAPFRTAVMPLMPEPTAVSVLPSDAEIHAAVPARVDAMQPAPAAQVGAPASAPATPAPPLTLPAPVLEAPSVPAEVAPPAPPASSTPVVASAPPAPVPAVKPSAAVTLAQAQPLLAALIQQVESGRGDRLLHMLDREARNVPAARALSRQLDVLVNGAHPVKLMAVEFRAEPAQDRLFVIGHIRLQAGDADAAVKRLSLRIEFMSRDGAVVMTGLGGLGDN